MHRSNDTLADRCQMLSGAVRSLSLLGVMVRRTDPHARPLPLVWVWCAPVLYRAFGHIDDLGRNTENRTKAARKGGCEVRWLEPLAMARERGVGPHGVM